MKKHTSKAAFYNRAFDEVVDLICRRSLVHCEPFIVCGYLFSTNSDLIAVRLGIEGGVVSDDMLIIAPPAQQAAIESTIRRLQMDERVERLEVVGVRFWGGGDRAVFEEEFGLAVQ